jgi:hypothetical protein
MNNGEQFFNTAAGGGYSISRSLRFSSADSSFLSRTPASAGNRKTWTWAGWVKRSSPQQTFQSLFTSSNNNFILRFEGDAIVYYDYNGDSFNSVFQTAAVYRDYSAWMHIVFVYDSTNATSTDRLRLYVNGVRVTQFAGGPYALTYPSFNANSFCNNNVEHRIGGEPSYTSRLLDGYLADCFLIDGQALDPTAFGEFSATTGVWVPKAYTGSYGTNGFHLDFADNSAATAAALGKDTSGLGNNWTPNNLSISDGLTSVSAATGALPIYNTTDTYGTVKGTGTRTDSNSGSIVLAVAMNGVNNGTTFTDESATIKGSGSAKTVTANFDAKTNTAVSKFYGSSGAFDGSDDYLQVSNSSDFSFGTGAFTFECWAYFPDGTTDYGIFGNSVVGELGIRRTSGGKLMISRNNTAVDTQSNSVLAGGKWHHLVIQRSGTTLKMFINGIEDISASNSQSYNCASPRIGTNNGVYLNGYIQDLRVYNGIAKYTGNFNPPSSTQIPSIAIGNDSLVDVPTNGSEVDTGLGGQVRGNYAVLNPLALTDSVKTYSNGNLEVTITSNNNLPSVVSTVGAASGKWYAEVLAGWSASGIGFINAASVTNSIEGSYGLGTPSDGWLRYGTDIFNNNGTHTSGLTSVATNDIVQLALDLDNGKAWFGRNGTWENSGNPATGSNPSVTFTPGGKTFLIGSTLRRDNVAVTMVHNFGARSFAYTAPSGFKALNTANLPAPLVTKASTVFDVKLYTGNGSTQTISGLGFSPDFLWIKDRTSAVSHRLFDQVRGASAALFSNLTNAENTSFLELDSFNSDGFTVATTNGTGTNANSDAYVAWAWDAGNTTVTNTQGSISSQVRANASAGFSVVTYTTPGSLPGTIGHGLGAEPYMIITKSRGASGSWGVYHKSIGNTNLLVLNGTNAAFSGPNQWNSTTPTSAVFSIGTDYATSSTYVAYCFAPVVGYSSFGSYTGNGSADGPFVFCGFRPRWILIKASSSVSYGNWVLHDTARSSSNVSDKNLYANLSNSEDSTYSIDVLGNGFKLRSAAFDGTNGSGATYVYCAFAESPFAANNRAR